MFQVVSRLKILGNDFIIWAKDLKLNEPEESGSGAHSKLLQVQAKLIEDPFNSDLIGEEELSNEDRNFKLEHEAAIHRPKSSGLWLKLGDKNTKYFHSVCSHINNINSIYIIRDNIGGWITGPKVSMDHFKNIINKPHLLIEDGIFV